MGVWVAAAALLLLQLGCSSLVAADTRGTIIVDAGRELCFYEQLTLGMPFVIDYRVFFGGNNDINFRMRDPQRNIISNGNKQTAETVQGHATMPGEHEICFNNKFSTVSFKKVFFSLTLGDEKLAFMDSIHVMTMGPFDTSVLNIHTRLESIITEQQFHSSTEAYSSQRCTGCVFARLFQRFRRAAARPPAFGVAGCCLWRHLLGGLLHTLGDGHSPLLLNVQLKFSEREKKKKSRK